MTDKTRAEKAAILALAISIANAMEIDRQNRWKRKVRSALWPLF
jgi:hypothetical protein